MSDVNLLPEDLRENEERELKRKERDITIQMSTPMVEDEQLRRKVTVAASAAKEAPDDPKLKRVREESYIRVNSAGKIIHEEPSAEPIRRAPPWWRRLFPARVRIQKISTPQEKVKPTTSTHPVTSSMTSTPQVTPAQSTITTVRSGGVAIKKETPTVPASVAAKVATMPQAKVSAKSLGTNEPLRASDPLGPPSLGVNLIPGEWALTPVATNLRVPIIMALLVVFLATCAGSVLGRMVYSARQQQRLTSLEDERKKIEADIAALASRQEAWLTMRNRLSTLDILLKQHVNIAPAFTLLERTVIPEVTYTSVDVARDGVITVAGKTGSHELLAKQVVAIERSEPAPESVTIVGLSADPASQEVEFRLSITVPATSLTYAAR